MQRSVSLTAMQCEDLSRALSGALAECSSAAADHECLRAISGLGQDFRSRLADEQWPAVTRHLEQLSHIAHALAAPRADKPTVLRKVRVVTEDKQGKIQWEFQAEELRLDFGAK